ncbi:LacI family DNA-binding transcriptional regulator [Herbiconiux moechotypicola]|uniref:LacI family DNA-binding transcriptional regulator n=1 Tax=Herbiconiux moechotypicola TaxID=637393 RepID=A0ABP5R7D4_9MICO|nr:LacI family DNA-binding transcriptional regulator [Herbiconiux moechotypicola]MCS5732013.1 LacI family DNA-binding transcriptional regulator [Herbiconiux moechotypicola]
MKKSATAKDVAERAGVSRSAVSMVLNGRADGMVAKPSQERILRAARELNYVPNSIAVSLRNSRTQTVGIVTDVLTSPFAGRLMTGAHRAADAAGYFPLIIDTGHRDADIGFAGMELLNRQVDGLLIATESMHTVSMPEEFTGVPVALANCMPSVGGVAAFVPDEVAGGRQATEHLLDLGHTEVYLLAGTRAVAAMPLRQRGFEQALMRRGLAAAGRVISTGWDIDDGFAAARTLFARAPEVTAVLCANDRVAVGVLLAAAAVGRRVPEDLSVVGYDDEERVASRAVPALTTVALPHEKMGSLAMAALIDRVRGQGKEGAEIVRVPCELVVRGSTGAAST